MSQVLRALHIEGEAAKGLLLNIRDVIGDDEEMIETAIEGETDLKEVISRAVDRIAECEANADVLATRQKTLSDRRQRFIDQADRIKAAIHVAMDQVELRKLELAQATISLRALPAKLETPDEAAIPSKYWKPQDPKLDRKAVLDALKAGEAVPGAALSNGGQTISIRDK